uniref:Uncharacterized protein n=1 Tax=Molossus molossus TaxID=27622 RepID=A0A7J8JXK0_MOLMO|nr:hypothetical protein HJG59_008042 [Molossus molossus]
MVGSQKGLIAFVKKKLNPLSLDPSDLIICHCIIHQESLCAQLLWLNSVMSTIMSCINFVKSREFNSCQFKELLQDLDSEYRDLVYHCEVRWLSHGKMVMKFYKLWGEVKQFMEVKGKPVRELNDSKWLCDLAFVVDITKYLSDLNVKLQGANQLLSSLLSNVKLFEAKLRLWKVELKRNNKVHFPTLEGQKHCRTLEYAVECSKLIETFNERFKDMKSKPMKLNIFATPFNVEPVDVPDKLQHKTIQFQSDDELKARSNHLSLLGFYKCYISSDECPTLRTHELKYASVFGTTYCCEQSFSKLSIAKSRLHSRLTNANLEKQLSVATSPVPAHITGFTKEKQFQVPAITLVVS